MTINKTKIYREQDAFYIKDCSIRNNDSNASSPINTIAVQRPKVNSVYQLTHWNATLKIPDNVPIRLDPLEHLSVLKLGMLLVQIPIKFIKMYHCYIIIVKLSCYSPTYCENNIEETNRVDLIDWWFHQKLISIYKCYQCHL